MIGSLDGVGNGPAGMALSMPAAGRAISIHRDQIDAADLEGGFERWLAADLDDVQAWLGDFNFFRLRDDILIVAGGIDIFAHLVL